MADRGEYNESIDFIDQKIERKEHKYWSLKGLIDGSLLAKNQSVMQLPYILFLVILSVFYIANRYSTERIIAEANNLRNEVKELRSEAITTSAELMFISKQSEVVRLIEQKELGLEETLDPPMKIEIVED